MACGELEFLIQDHVVLCRVNDDAVRGSCDALVRKFRSLLGLCPSRLGFTAAWAHEILDSNLIWHGKGLEISAPGTTAARSQRSYSGGRFRACRSPHYTNCNAWPTKV